jgi:serine protease Do
MRLRSLTVSAFSAGLFCLASASSLPILAAPTQFSGEENVGIDVYKSANPSVVTIKAGRATGSGSIVSNDGLVLTNHHVIRDSNGQVQIITSAGKQYTGSVVAVDRRNDLALIKLQTSDRLPVIRIANSSGILVGQRVFALGSPFGQSGTLTTGILNRVSPRNGDLQTDATLNPGNSGGPLLNSRGEMIGVNKAVFRPGSGSTNFGIATSVIVAQEFIQGNRNNVASNFRTATRPESRTPEFEAPEFSSPAPTTPARRGQRLGVTIDPETLVIAEVQPSSIASFSGLQRGDRLIALNGQRLVDVVQIISFLEQRPSSAVITIARNRRFANLQIRF